MRFADIIFLAAAIAGAMVVFAAVAMPVATYRRQRTLGVREPLPFTGSLGHFLDEVDTSPRAFALAAVLLVGLAALGALAQSDFGSRATARGVGWAHDLSLVEAIRAGDDPSSLGANLGELSFAPNASHRVVAAISALTGARPPAAMQAVTALLVVAGSALVALRAALLPAHSLRARVAAAVAAAAGFVVLSRFHLGFADYGDLFPQLFGTVLAIGGYLALLPYRARPRLAAPAALVFGAGVLPFFDGIPAAWFLLSAALLLVPARGGGLPSPLDRRAVFAAAFVLLAAAGLAANPAFRSYLDIARNNGSFGFDVPFTSYSTNLSENPRVLWAVPGVALLAVLFAALVARYRPGRAGLAAAMPWLAGFVAALVLFAATGAAEALTGELSPSLMARQVYLVTLEGVVATSAFAGLAAARIAHGRRERAERSVAAIAAAPRLWRLEPSLMALGMAAILFLVQSPFLDYTHRQTYLMDLRAGLIEHIGDQSFGNADTRPYPQFELLPAENYYLAIGVLRIPRDARTDAWFNDQGATGATNVPAAWVARALPAFDGRTLLFKAGGNAAPFEGTGWSMPEDFGTWTDGPRADLRWRWLQRPDGMLLTLTAAANVTAARPEQRVDVFVNGTKVDSWVFQYGEEVTTRGAIVRPELVALADSAEIRFELPDATSGATLGASNDTRQLALAVHELSVEPLARYDGRPIFFGAETPGLELLQDGWSVPETAGTWTDGKVVTLAWRNTIRSGANATFTLQADPYLTEAHPTLGARVYVNDQLITTWQFSMAAPTETVFRVPAAILALSSVTEVRLEMDDATSPKALGLGQDARVLGLFFRSLSAAVD